MRIITAAEVESALEFKDLIERLRRSFRQGAEVPPRQTYDLTGTSGGENGANLLLMPAWQPDRHIGIKLATVFPGNPELSLPSVMGAYLLLSGKTGQPLAMIDGPALTLKRTAAASALAASYLARQDCERLLMIGTGKLAPHLIQAHAAVRPICNVLIWGRDAAKAKKLARKLDRRDFRVAATTDLEAAVRGAHIVSAATMARDPLIDGNWLQPGQHIDLVGGYRPDMREANDAAIDRARVFVDTRAGACREAGDIVQPLESGRISLDDIAGDLYDLTRGDRAGRRFYDQITLFKSVGTALEDLGAAQMAYERT